MVTLIGLGGGSAGSMTAEALAALQNAEIVIGARRLIEALPDLQAEKIAEYRPEAILALIRKNETRPVCLALSGDTGFYSGADRIAELLRREKIEFRILPGLSSVQILAARIGLPWQDWRLVSAHGTACDPVREVLSGQDVFFLTGGKTTPGTMCEELTRAGFGNLPAVVGEDLTYPGERIRQGSVSEFAGERFSALSVLLVRAEVPASPGTVPAAPGAVPAASGADPASPGSGPEAAGRIMIAAMASGSGKTVLTAGLLRALALRGISVEAMKCGPDYIDPMFHARVTGVPCRNLDLFLMGEQGVARALAGQRGSFAVIEGAMGFYDGTAGTSENSAWEIAAREGIPVILAVRPGGSGATLAAQIKGLLSFRQPSMIAGVILTVCRPGLHAYLKPVIERETGLPVLGYLPPMREAEIESRHLGLMTAGEIADLTERFDAIAAQLEKTADLDRLCALAGKAAVLPGSGPECKKKCTIAVARDEAFSFYYEDSLEALRRAGAEVIFFSPLHDRELPACGGLYLGGGYPELFARELEENEPMRTSIREHVLAGLPTVAECGGFLYLQQSLEDADGETRAMAGVLPGHGFKTGRLQRFGYAHLMPRGDSLLFMAGEKVPVHEFHHWDSTENGSDLTAEKPDGRSWTCGFASPSLYAGFPHLHFGGELPLAERFAEAAAERERKNDD